MIKLPDFDDVVKVIDEIRDANLEKLKLELALKLGESNVTSKAFSDPKYQVNGKVPSMEFVKSAFLTTGLENELIEYRTRLVLVTARVDDAKLRLQFYRDLMDLYRTESANQRSSSL